MFFVLVTLVLWVVYSNSELVALKFIGLWQGQGIPNPFTWAGGGAYLWLPLGLWLFFFTILGLVMGLSYAWFVARPTRVRARQQERRARAAEQALLRLKKEAEITKTEIDNLKTEKKDLEIRAKTAESTALPPSAEIKTV